MRRVGGGRFRQARPSDRLRPSQTLLPRVSRWSPHWTLLAAFALRFGCHVADPVTELSDLVVGHGGARAVRRAMAELQKLQERRAALEDELAKTEKQIYDLEGEYLQERHPYALRATAGARAAARGARRTR